MLKQFFNDLLDCVLALFFLGFVVGLFYSFVQAEPLIGQDVLGINQKNFKWVNYNELGTPGGLLDWTFGDDGANTWLYLKEVRPTYFRTHLLNTTCVRNGNCGPYEPVAGYTISTLDKAIRAHNQQLINWVKKRTKIYKEESQKFPDVKFLLSPALEHNLSKESWRILADAVLEIWPDVQLVNSPLTLPQERYRGAWLEGHGAYAPTYVDIVSLDGTDATDISIGAWLKRYKNTKVRIQYVHSRGYNCRNQGPWEDPRERDSCPTRATLELLAHITDNRGPAPKSPSRTVCLSTSPFQGPSIWKPLAEDKGTGDPRANLPVAILAANGPRIEVVEDDKIRGFLGLYGEYQRGLNRFYSGQIGSGKSGYQFSPGWAWLKQGKKCWGPLITGRRQGAVHD